MGVHFAVLSPDTSYAIVRGSLEVGNEQKQQSDREPQKQPIEQRNVKHQLYDPGGRTEGCALRAQLAVLCGHTYGHSDRKSFSCRRRLPRSPGFAYRSMQAEAIVAMFAWLREVRSSAPSAPSSS